MPTREELAEKFAELHTPMDERKEAVLKHRSLPHAAEPTIPGKHKHIYKDKSVQQILDEHTADHQLETPPQPFQAAAVPDHQPEKRRRATGGRS